MHIYSTTATFYLKLLLFNIACNMIYVQLQRMTIIIVHHYPDKLTTLNNLLILKIN